MKTMLGRSMTSGQMISQSQKKSGKNGRNRKLIGGIPKKESNAEKNSAKLVKKDMQDGEKMEVKNEND
jgi:hypothetical protein